MWGYPEIGTPWIYSLTLAVSRGIVAAFTKWFKLLDMSMSKYGSEFNKNSIHQKEIYFCDTSCSTSCKHHNP